MSLFGSVFGFFKFDLALDLGTTKTVFITPDNVKKLLQSTIVAIDKVTGEIANKGQAAGNYALKIIGKTSPKIEVIRPVRGGIITEDRAVIKFLNKYIEDLKAETGKKLAKPRILVGIPPATPSAMRRIFTETILKAGAKEVLLIEQPVTAVIGARFFNDDNIQNSMLGNNEAIMVVDIGGGTTDIAVVCMGDIISRVSIPIAGEAFDEAVVAFLRNNHQVIISMEEAENLKRQIGTLEENHEERTSVIYGKTTYGSPVDISVTSSGLRDIFMPVAKKIMDNILYVLQDAPSQMSRDIIKNGFILCGGGALLKGLEKLIADELNIRPVIPPEPNLCVARGLNRIIGDLDNLQDKLPISRE